MASIDLFWAWPTVGAGTHADPYRISWVPTTIEGKAAAIMAGITCFDPDTGIADHDSPNVVSRESQDYLRSFKVIGQAGHHNIIHAVVDNTYHERLVASGIARFTYPNAMTLQELAEGCDEVRYFNTARLERWRDDLPWTDAVDVAAVTAIDDLQAHADAVAPLVRSFYESVIDPNLSTPEWPDGLIQRVDDGQAVNMAMLAQITVPDSLTRAVRVGDLSFQTFYLDQLATQVGSM